MDLVWKGAAGTVVMVLIRLPGAVLLWVVAAALLVVLWGRL
jgi:uncharacterized membrane protein (GlpM family)